MCFTTLAAIPKHFFGFGVRTRSRQPQRSNLTRLVYGSSCLTARSYIKPHIFGCIRLVYGSSSPAARSYIKPRWKTTCVGAHLAEFRAATSRFRAARVVKTHPKTASAGYPLPTTAIYRGVRCRKQESQDCKEGAGKVTGTWSANQECHGFPQNRQKASRRPLAGFQKVPRIGWKRFRVKGFRAKDEVLLLDV